MSKCHVPKLIVLSVALPILAGCMNSGSPEERQISGAIELVIEYIPEADDGTVSGDAGPYQGGTAIIGGPDMAFWVMDGTAYTVNEAAMEAAPDLEQAPDNIEYGTAFIEATSISRNGSVVSSFTLRKFL